MRYASESLVLHLGTQWRQFSEKSVYRVYTRQYAGLNHQHYRLVANIR